jgi:hypothetical protein
MKSLSKAECRDWALTHGLPVNDSFGRPIPSEMTNPTEFLIPSDAGARVALARAIWFAVADGVESLLWVTDWGVWQSGEHPPLNNAVRTAFGATKPLIEAPGHLVAGFEPDAGSSLFVLSILNLWDAWLIPAGDRPGVFISHDEYGIVEARHGEHRITALLREFDVLREATP